MKRRLPASLVAALLSLALPQCLLAEETPAVAPAAVPSSAATETPAAPAAPAAHPAPPEARSKVEATARGKRSPDERTANREQARQKLLERFDADGDGALNADERRAAEAEREAKLLERFDVDGDGALSETERAAARGPLKKPAAGAKKPGAAKAWPHPRPPGVAGADSGPQWQIS